MDGVYKIVLIFIFITFLGCKKQHNNVSIAKELISTNINILIDSVETFDVSKYKNSQKSKKNAFSIGLIDTVEIDNEILKNKSNVPYYVSLKLNSNDIINFKSEYEVDLVSVDNLRSDILFIKFKNLKIEGKKANIEVKKTRGIGMINAIYFFEKINDKWIFKNKKILNMG